MGLYEYYPTVQTTGVQISHNAHLKKIQYVISNHKALYLC